MLPTHATSASSPAPPLPGTPSRSHSPPPSRRRGRLHGDRRGQGGGGGPGRAVRFEMEVRKLPGKRNRRLVRARVRVGASLQAVRATLTDYEGLAGFIPGLSECRLLHQDAAFARLYQVGEQDLALGFKFNAKGTIDCYEGEMEVLPESRSRRRQIAFDKVDVDLKVFEGKWSVQEARRHLDRGVGERRGRGWRFRSVIFLDAGGSVSIQPKRQTASGAAFSGRSWRLRGGGQWGSATGRGQGR